MCCLGLENVLLERQLTKKEKNNSILKECFFVLKGFDQFQELKTTAKKSLHVALIGFLCFLDLDELLLKEK